MSRQLGLALSLAACVGLSGGCASALQNAAERGDIQGVRTLWDQGAGKSKEDVADAFVHAAGAGQLQIVQLLLEKGAELDVRGSCDHPWYNSFGAVVANVTFSDATGLICAAAHGDAKAVKFFLDHGADVNAAVMGGKWTALYSAAYLGHSQIVKLLLDRGVEDVSGPLKLVRENNRHPQVDNLLEQAEARQLGTASPVASTPQSMPMPVPAVASVTASDVDTPPTRRAKVKENAYAVVIGIDTYRNKLPKADYASHDAEVMAAYLTKVMGYEEENVAVLLNDRAAKTDLEKYLEHWLPKRVEPGASVFIYFSGHGAPNAKTGDAYLVPYDGDPAFVDATGYPLKRLYDQVGKLQAKEVVVMLDSCFSGAGGRSVIAKGMRPMVLSVENSVLAGGKTVVLSASQGDQVSSTYDQKGHGLLTYFFLKGLQGEADKNKDGSVDLAELFTYLKPQVERKARRDFNNEQTPQLLGSPELLKRGVRLVERAGP